MSQVAAAKIGVTLMVEGEAMRMMLAGLLLVVGCAADAAMPSPNCEAIVARCCVATGQPAPNDLACDGVPSCASGAAASCDEDADVMMARDACVAECAPSDSACSLSCIREFEATIQRAVCSDGSAPTC